MQIDKVTEMSNTKIYIRYNVFILIIYGFALFYLIFGPSVQKIQSHTEDGNPSWIIPSPDQLFAMYYDDIDLLRPKDTSERFVILFYFLFLYRVQDLIFMIVYESCSSLVIMSSKRVNGQEIYFCLALKALPSFAILHQTNKKWANKMSRKVWLFYVQINKLQITIFSTFLTTNFTKFPKRQRKLFARPLDIWKSNTRIRLSNYSFLL